MLLSRATILSALLFTFANGVFGAVPLFLLPWLTRVLSPTEYGLVAMFTILTQLVSALTGLSVQGAVGIRYFQRDEIDFPRYVASCLVVLAGSTLVVLALAAATMPLIERLTQLSSGWIILAIVVSSAQFVIQVQLSIWQASRQPMKFAALRLGQVGVDVLASLSLVIALGYAWEGRPLGVAMGFAFAAVLAAYRLFAAGWLRFPADRKQMTDALRFGLPLVPHALGGMLIALSDRLVITNLLGLAEAGIYTVAVQIGLAVLLVADGVNRTVSPWIFEQLKLQDDDANIRIVRLVYGYLLLMLAGGAIAGSIAAYLMPLLAGDEFGAAAQLIPYIAFGQAIGGMYLMVSNFVFYAGATGRLAMITLSAGLANIALSYLLISRFGLAGAPIAFVFAQTILFLGAWLLAAKAIPLPWLRALSRLDG